jgi:hypothetical protein
MGTLKHIGRVAAVGLAVALIAPGCSKDGPVNPPTTGALQVTATYEGLLGAVDAEHPLLARLYAGSNPDAQGTPDHALSGSTNPSTLLFTGLPAGSYTLCVLFDAGGDTLQQTCPYEVYQDKAFGVAPDPVAVTAGGTATLAVAFDDTHLRQPGDPLPSFALPDSNPSSESYGTTVALADLAHQRAVLYFGEAPSEPLPDFSLVDINPDSPTRDQWLALSDWAGGPVVIYFGTST